jgi:hypothetical protein
MFLKDALLRSSQLEDEMASVYAQLATCPAVDAKEAAAWSAAAAREQVHARLLHALAKLSEALGDDGPFLVQVPVQLSALRRAVEGARARLAADMDAAAAGRCAGQLEAAPRRELYASLLEVAEPEVRRVLRLIDEETRGPRRSGSRSRSREDRRMRGACSPPAA